MILCWKYYTSKFTQTDNEGGDRMWKRTRDDHMIVLMYYILTHVNHALH